MTDTLEPTVRLNDYLPKQRIAHQLLAYRCDELYYGGAQGGGKTAFGARFICQFAIEHPGAKIAVFRRKKDDLLREILPRFHSLLRYYPYGEWRAGEETYYVSDGQGHEPARIYFLHCQHEVDAEDYQTEEWQAAWFEEASQFPYSIMRKLRTRVRTGSSGIPTKKLFTSNPDGEGNDWLCEDFVDHDPMGLGRIVEHETEHVGADGILRRGIVKRAFLQALYTDNRYVRDDPQFLYDLNQLDEDLLASRRDGDHSKPSGRFFKEWNRSLHTCEPFDPPADWPVWRSLDLGYHPDALCCLWFAQDPNPPNRIYVWQELHEMKLTDPEAKARICQMSAGRKASYTVTGRDAKRTQTTGERPINTWEVYARNPNSVPLSPANQQRDFGWKMVRAGLRTLPDGLPAVRIMWNCTNLIRALPKMQYHEHKNWDIKEHPDDHAPDSFRYGLCSRYGKMPAFIADSLPDPREPKDPNPANLVMFPQPKTNQPPWRRMVGGRF